MRFIGDRSYLFGNRPPRFHGGYYRSEIDPSGLGELHLLKGRAFRMFLRKAGVVYPVS